MPCTLSQSQFHRLAEARPTLKLGDGGAAGLYSRFCPVPQGGGVRFARVDLPGRFRAVSAEFDLADALEVMLDDPEELSLGFFIKGALSGTVTGRERQPLELQAGHAILRAPSRDGFRVHIPKHEACSFLKLRLHRQFLVDWLAQLGVDVPDAFLAQLAARDGRLLADIPWTVETQIVLHQIADFRYGPSAFLCFLQAKSIELLTLFSCELGEQLHPRRRAEEGPAELAHRVLLEDLSAPASIPALARKAGVSVSHLQSAFRSRYGTSPYAYLRNARLERARALLGESAKPVIDVVQEVGWSCPSRFTAAFRARYGITPTAWRKRAAG